jgi:hypothetical protein
LVALQELKGPKDSAQHVTAHSHTEIYVLPVHDPQKDQMHIYFLNPARNLAQDIGYNPQNVIAVDLVDLPQFDQPVVVVNIGAYALLDCLQLSQYLFRPRLGYNLGHLIDRVEEMPLNLQFGIDIKKSWSELSRTVLYLLNVYIQRHFLLIDYSGKHGEKIAVVYRPNFLHNDVGNPLRVPCLLDASVVDDPFSVRTQAGAFQVVAPFDDQLPYPFLIGLLLARVAFGK